MKSLSESMSTFAMRELITMDEFEVSEEKLWDNLVIWAEKAASANFIQPLDAEVKSDEAENEEKLKLLRSVCDLVRFGWMDIKYFAAKVEPENVLSKDDIIDIVFYISEARETCGRFNIAYRGISGWHTWQKKLKVGMKIDARDRGKKWYRATIVVIMRRSYPTKVKVHYEGYGDKWDKWLNVRSQNVAPFGTKR